MPRTAEQFDEISKDTRKTERQADRQRRERLAKKSEPTPLNERLVAPMLLIVTILISYLIVLFS